MQCLLLPLLIWSPAVGQAAFEPVLERADVTPRVVRPGEAVACSFVFRNAGQAAPAAPYRVFVHFEDPEQGCLKIAWQADHEPAEPLVFLLPGERLVDGPLRVTVPEETPAGQYRVHVGLFNEAGRVLEAAAGEVTVDPLAAAQPAAAGPAPLAAAEVQRRRAAAAQLAQPVTLATPTWRFAIDPASGRWTLTDLAATVTWTSDPLHDRAGRAMLRRGDQVVPVVLRDFTVAEQTAQRLVLAHAVKGPDGQPLGVSLRLRCEVAEQPLSGLRLSCATFGGRGEWQIDRLWLLDSALPVTEAGQGRTVVPWRLGRGLQAADGPPLVEGATTYDGSTMRLLSLEQQGAALAVTWTGVDARYQVRRIWAEGERLPGARALLHSLEQWNLGAGAVTLHPLGRGDYVTAAKAYRAVAARDGWRVTRAELARRKPEVNALAGAADFKPFVFSRSVVGSRYNTTGAERTNLGHTFAETAEMAEHLRRDLAIDQAMVVLAGWIKRGYDNQHPDILPAAPECGGNEELAAAATRIKACGYLFGLHDNYQDMYQDAPSFDVKYLRQNAAGKPLMGGNWAGGQAWQVRPHDQLALAKRNLPEVRRLFGPTIYFIDTTFAWGLVDSQAPADRWSRADDLRLKSALCRYARQQMGAFGSEEGREWAVPVADYLEGLLGHKYDTQPGEVLPLFPLVYHDCVSLYTHQSTRLGPDDAKRVLDQLIYAEMPVYSFGPHRWWTAQGDDTAPLQVVAEVTPAGPRAFDITYRWTATGRPAADYRCFVHFTSAQGGNEGIAFQNDHELPATSRWEAGKTYADGPHRVEVPENVRGEVAIRLGLLLPGGERVGLAMNGGENGRYRLGTVRITPAGAITYEAVAPAGPRRPFARNEGWTKDLGATDRFIKNTYEVLSWVHRLTFNLPFEEHQVAGQVERARFGENLRIVVNYGAQPVEVEAGPVLGQVTLPQYGFAVWSPTFVAVHATAAAGRTYPTPVLFTARSLDDQPLASSAKVRVYHGCGGPELALGGRTITVEREAEVALR